MSTFFPQILDLVLNLFIYLCKTVNNVIYEQPQAGDDNINSLGPEKDPFGPAAPFVQGLTQIQLDFTLCCSISLK